VIQFTCCFLVHRQNCSSAGVAVRASFVLLLVSEVLRLSSLWSWRRQASSSFGLGQGGSFLLSVIHSTARRPGAAQVSPTARSCCLDPDFQFTQACVVPECSLLDVHSCICTFVHRSGLSFPIVSRLLQELIPVLFLSRRIENLKIF
jgi:hypothetical protein